MAAAVVAVVCLVWHNFGEGVGQFVNWTGVGFCLLGRRWVVGLNRSYFRGYKQLWNPTGDPVHGVERHPGFGCSVGSVTKFSTSPLKDNPES